MALVENHGSPRRNQQQLATEKRVKVLVEARAVNSSFHGAKLREGENILTVPKSLLEELLEQVEDADWTPVVERYQRKIQELCYNSSGEKVKDESEVVYNLSLAFKEQYLREPRRFKRVEVLEENIPPKLDQTNAVTVALLDKLASVQQSGRKGRAKSADGSTE